MTNDKMLAESPDSNGAIAESGSPLLKEVDNLLQFIDNFDHLNVLLLKMKLIYLQHEGGIFTLRPSDVEDLTFLVNFLERCQTLKSTN